MKIQIKTNIPQEKLGFRKHTSRLCNFFISLSLYLLFFATPLFFTNLTLQGMGFDKMLFFYFWLLVGVIAWMFKGIGEGEVAFKRTPLDIPIILVLIASLLSAIFSVDKWGSFFGPFGIPQKSFLAIFSFAIFYWFLVSNITEKRLQMILRAILFSAGIVAVFMAAKLLGVGGIVLSRFNIPERLKFLFEPGFNAVGLLGDLGVFCFVGLLLIETKRQRDKEIEEIGEIKEINKHSFKKFISLFLYFFISILLIYVIFALFNYINPYILLFPLSIILIFSVSKIIDIGKFSKYFTAILFLVILGLSIFKYNPKITRVDLPAEVGLSFSASWDIAKSAIKQNWAAGSGIGTFKYVFSKYRPGYINNSQFWQTKFAENPLIFEIVETSGVVGGIAVVIFILVYLGVGYAVLAGKKLEIKKLEIGDKIRCVADNFMSETISNIQYPISLFVSSLMLILYCLFSLSSTTIILYTAMMSSLFVAALSLYKNDLFKEYVISYETSPQYALAMAFVFVVFIAGGIVLFALIGKTALADAYAKNNNMGKAIELANFRSEYFVKLGNENLDNAIEETKKQRDKEIKESFESRNLNLETRIPNPEIGNQGTKIENQDLEKIRQLFVSSLNAHKAAIAIAPNDAEVWESFAGVCEQIANYDPALVDDAIGAYEKALELDPINPLVDIHLGRLKLLKSGILKDDKAQVKSLAEEAKICYNKAIELKPDLKEAHEGLAMSEEYLGNLELAVKIYLDLFAAQPKSEVYPYKIAQLYEALGDKENAKKYYQKTLENVGDREGAEEVREIISKSKFQISN